MAESVQGSDLAGGFGKLRQVACLIIISKKTKKKLMCGKASKQNYANNWLVT